MSIPEDSLLSPDFRRMDPESTSKGNEIWADACVKSEAKETRAASTVPNSPDHHGVLAGGNEPHPFPLSAPEGVRIGPAVAHALLTAFGQKYLRWLEKASSFSVPQASQRMRAKPLSKSPHSTFRMITSRRYGRQKL